MRTRRAKRKTTDHVRWFLNPIFPPTSFQSLFTRVFFPPTAISLLSNTLLIYRTLVIILSIFILCIFIYKEWDLGFCSRGSQEAANHQASLRSASLISARFSTLVRSSIAATDGSFIRSVVGDCAAEDNAPKRSPEVFVEYGVNDLEIIIKKKTM